MNTHDEADEAIVSALVEIMRERVEEIARTIELWGAASDEVDSLLRECLKAAEIKADTSPRPLSAELRRLMDRYRDEEVMEPSEVRAIYGHPFF